MANNLMLLSDSRCHYVLYLETSNHPSWTINPPTEMSEYWGGAVEGGVSAAQILLVVESKHLGLG